MIVLPFIKMHGCGNDYVFVDGLAWTAGEFQHVDFSEVARHISDRHRGVGSDGLVLMLPADGIADAWMKMFNADGSEGALCGNALRCMAMWLHQSGHCGATCRIEIRDRMIDAEVLSSDPATRTATVRIDIGKPVVVSPDAGGLTKYVRPVELTDVSMNGQPLQLWNVSMGNPHAIILADDVESLDLSKIGPQVECHPKFPDRTNVEFVQITGRNGAIVRVWERGSGETQACGSGACASAVMGWACNIFAPGQPVQIHMPGGDLIVRMTADDLISVEGPAEESFRGEIRWTKAMEG